MPSVVRRARSPFALSLIFCLSLGLIFAVSQFAASPWQPISQPITDNRQSLSSFKQKQNESSAALDERERAAREFDLLKRATPGASEISDTIYQSARDHLCRMPHTFATLNQASEGGSAWMSLGPEGAHAQENSIDPCRTESRDARRSPLSRNSDEIVFYRGAVSPDGKSFFGGTARHGMLRGSEPGEWQMLFDGTGGFVAVSPLDARTIFAAQSGLSLHKSFDGGRTFLEAAQGIDDVGLFIAPFAMDANDPRQMWAGGRSLWRTSDGAAQWTRASAEIAGSKQSLVSAIAVAPANPNLALAGTSEGFIHRGVAALASGADTEWPSVQPRGGFVSSLIFDPHDPNIAYATYSTFGGAHVWRSADGGASWTPIDGAADAALPDVPVHSVVIDPANKSHIFIGTDLGIFVTDDGGVSWKWDRAGFGDAAVESLVVHREGNESSLFAFTCGRGVWRLGLGPAQTCSYALSPVQSTFSTAGDTGSFNVTVASGCAWTAVANASWITITSGASGSGNGMVQFRVAANSDIGARAGVITVANQTFTIEQRGTGGACTAATITAGQTASGSLKAGNCVSRLRAGGAFYASRYTFTVADASLVAISASSTDFEPYLYLYSAADAVVAQNGQSGGNARIPAGSGYLKTPTNGTFTIEVTSLLPGRTGNFSLSLFVAPQGCDITALSATSAQFDAGGGSGSVQVATANGCPWTAVSTLPWVTIRAGSAGAGTMTVRYDVAAITTNTARRGDLTIAGKTLSIEQAGAGGACNPAPITPGQPVTGNLSQADCRLRRNGSSSSSENADYYSFSATAGQQITVSAVSSAITPHLALADVGGSVLIESGARLPAGSGYFTIPVTGPYTIEVSRDSFASSSSTGNYNLVLVILPTGCGYALGATGRTFNAAGGAASVNLATTGSCAWSAVNQADWITASPSSGTGGGPVNFSVAANATDRSRVGALLIAGQIFTIEQAGTGGSCPAVVLQSGQTVRSNITPADCRSRYSVGSFSAYQAELYSFNAMAGEQVQFTAVVAPPFSSAISVADASGALLAQTSSPTLSFTAPAGGTYFVEVAAELINSFLDRAYTLSLSVTPPGCGYVVSPANQFFEAAGGTGSVQVSTEQSCPWMASANVDWVSFSSAGGTGSGATNFTVAANTTNSARLAQINIAGQSVTVAQAGTGGSCAEQPITPGQTVNGTLTNADCRARSRGSDGLSFADRYVFIGTAGQQVRAVANASVGLYLINSVGTVLASGNARVPANGTSVSLPADGTYFIEVDTQTPGNSGLNYTLTLLVTPPGCGFVVAPLIQTFNENGGSGSFTVTTGQGCPWVVGNVPNWVTVNPASGSGPGTVSFTAAANTTTLRRRATLEISNQVFAIEQAGAGGTCGVRPITPGQVINGQLSRADCQPTLQFAINYVTERYSFNATAGDQIAILAVSSPGLVKTVTLLDPTGAVFAQTGAQRLPASGFFIAPVTGTYIIEFTSGNENLPYTLSLLLVPANCVFTVSPQAQTFEAAGGTGSIAITAGQDCPWWGVNTESWITINPGASGSGDGTVSFTVAPNTTTTRRRATLYVGGQSVVIEQAGTVGGCSTTPITIGQTINERLTVGDCRPRFRSDTDPYVADNYSFTFTAGQQVAISVNTSAFTPRISLSDANGALVAQGGGRIPAGNGFLTLPASGIYFIEVTVDRFVFASDNYTYALSLSTPTACAYSLAPSLQRFDYSGGSGNVRVVASAGCAWTAQANADWITINSGASGTGSGAVNFTVAANTPSNWRTGTITIGGQTFTIEQAGFGGNCVVMPITHGQTVNGTLTPSDCRTTQIQSSGLVFVDRYSFDVVAGDQVYVSLQGLTPRGPLGETFSPQYNLIAPNGVNITRSSSDPRGNDFLLSLPLAGTYLIEVTSSSAGDYALSLMRAPGRCAFRVTPSSQTFDLSGGAGSFDVATGQGCQWATAINFGADWLTITSGVSGSGSGKVAFTVAPNATPDARRADLAVAGQFVTVQQQTSGGTSGTSCAKTAINYGQTVSGDLGSGACPSVGSPNAASARQYTFAGAAGDRIALQAAAEFSPLLTIFGPQGVVLAQADGPQLPGGTEFITLPANGVYTAEIALRVSSVLDSYSLTLIGPSPGCSYNIASTTRSFEATGGTGSITVTTGNGCTWTATSNVSWVAITNASGSGLGTFNFTVAPSTTVNTRQATLTVAGQSLTIVQAGVGGMCSAMPITAGQPVFGTINQADCQARDRYFFNGTAGQQVVVSAGLFPAGNSTFQAELALFAPNGAALARATASTNTVRLPQSSGFITLPADGTYVVEIARGQYAGGDYRLALTLAPAACRYAIVPSSQIFEEAGGNLSVSVTADSSCAWEANSNVSWATISAGGSGTGNGTVGVAVVANTGALARTGTLNIAGRTFTIEQAGRGGTCTIKPLTAGQTVTGTFSDGDCGIRGSSRGDRYSLNGTAGDLIALQVALSNSSSSSPVIYLYGPSGTLLSSTDRSARLPSGPGFFTLPATGAYLVEIGPSITGTLGTYQLSLISVRPGCGFTLSPVIRRFEINGGSGSFTITTGPGCQWTVSTDAAWVMINGDGGGAGSGTVNFTVAANSTTRARIARLTVGSETFTVEQAGAGGTCSPMPLTPGQTVSGSVSDADCRSSLRPYAPFIAEQVADVYAFTGAAGDRVAVSVTLQSFNNLFLSLIAPNGQVVAENVGTRIPVGTGVFVLPISGTYLIDMATNGGIATPYTLALTLSSACALQVEPLELVVPAVGGNGTIKIAGGSGCDWLAVSSANWVSIAAATSLGSGNGTVSYAAAANPGPTPRTATLSIAGQTVNVRQPGVLVTVSASSLGGAEFAAESLVTSYGVGLSTATQIATTPVNTLAGTTVKVRDSAGMTRDALLLFVSPTQVNYQMPPGTANGPATISIASGDGTINTGFAQIVPVAPGLFAANANGSGVAAAVALRVKADGTRAFEPIARYDEAQKQFVPIPIDLGLEGEQVFLVGFGTGFRNRSTLDEVMVSAGGTNAPVNFAGAQGEMIGLDQFNALLPRSLAGRGEVNVILTADGKASNAVKIAIR